ncbi:MAG: NAD(P)H-dependent oxidoreductase [Ilumatobacteraceae bacterium]|nr:NAD(P)H-dependent oxidoreductase [Ilumatobacteraceae bacterium]
MPLIGLLCGSFRSESANQAVLNLIATNALKDSTYSTREICGLATLPTFRPEQVDSPPEVVADFRRQIDGVDGVIIAAPEYAAGLAGSTKNALDWLVGSSTLYRKPVAALSAGTTGGHHALHDLVHTLSWQGAWTFAVLGIAAPLPKMTNGAITHDATANEVASLTTKLVRAIREPGPSRRSALNSVVSTYGIDIERFGEVN